MGEHPEDTDAGDAAEPAASQPDDASGGDEIDPVTASPQQYPGKPGAGDAD